LVFHKNYGGDYPFSFFKSIILSSDRNIILSSDSYPHHDFGHDRTRTGTQNYILSNNRTQMGTQNHIAPQRTKKKYISHPRREVPIKMGKALHFSAV